MWAKLSGADPTTVHFRVIRFDVPPRATAAAATAACSATDRRIAEGEEPTADLLSGRNTTPSELDNVDLGQLYPVCSF